MSRPARFSGALMSNFTLDEFVPLLRRESRVRRGTMLAIFALISLTLLTVAFFWQKTYVSSVTLFVDDTNIVKPLLDGVAASSSQRDKASIAKEVLFSREILEKIVDTMAANGSTNTAIQKEEMMIEIVNRTSVQNINSTLLVISFEDKSPKVAYDVVRLYADLFLDKTMRAQSVESSDAFEFIVNQVETYRGKLEDAELRLENFRAEYPGARPGTEGNVDERIIELRRQLEQTELQYGEMNQRRKSLSAELANESSTLEQEYRESQFREQINELQAQIDLLRLNYTDDYPDIIRLKQQIADFTQLAQGEAARRSQARQNGAAGGTFSINGAVYSGASNLSPVYQALRGDLSRATAETNSLRSRMTQTRALLEKELSRAEQSTRVERELAELTRDYTINKEIYEELVKRRESARVSMSLGLEKQGVLYRIQEAANFPVLPNGLRFMHIALAGLLLGFALPVVYLIGFLKLDPRIRTASAITDDLQLPLLTVVPHMQLPGSKTPWSQQPIAAAVVVGGVLVIFAVVGWIKYSQGIV